MKIAIAARGFTLTDALRAAVEREAWALQRRLNGRASHFIVRLYDINGHRGGNDKACSVQMRLLGESAEVVASDLDANLYRAISGAFCKVERGVRGALARTRTLRRRAGNGRSRMAGSSLA